MIVEQEKTYQIKLASEIKNLNEVQIFVDKIVEDYNIDIDDYGNILISLTEAVTNAIVHGNKNNPQKMVSVSFNQPREEWFEFIVADEGKGFDFKNIPDPTDEKNILKPSGRGLFIIKSLSDEVCFQEQGNKVSIKFKINQS